jgi:dCTP deaminase
VIIAEDEIMGQINRWKTVLPENTPDKDASKFVDDQVSNVPVPPQPKPTEGRASLLDNILVYPYPRHADNKYDERGHSRVYGAICELTLGADFFLTSEKLPRKLSDLSGQYDVPSPFFTIEPGEFAVLVTEELVYLPNDVFAFLSVRNRYKQRGLISVSGFHVDPGFHGKIVLTVYNAGPQEIPLKYRERMFMLAFSKVGPNARPYGKGPSGLSAESIAALKGTSLSPRGLEARLRRLETIIEVLLIPLVAALIISLISLLKSVFAGAP